MGSQTFNDDDEIEVSSILSNGQVIHILFILTMNLSESAWRVPEPMCVEFLPQYYWKITKHTACVCFLGCTVTCHSVSQIFPVAGLGKSMGSKPWWVTLGWSVQLPSWEISGHPWQPGQPWSPDPTQVENCLLSLCMHNHWKPRVTMMPTLSSVTTKLASWQISIFRDNVTSWFLCDDLTLSMQTRTSGMSRFADIHALKWDISKIFLTTTDYICTREHHNLLYCRL